MHFINSPNLSPARNVSDRIAIIHIVGLTSLILPAADFISTKEIKPNASPVLIL